MWGGRAGEGGQGGCGRRSKVFVKIQKKNRVGVGVVCRGEGDRADVDEELKLLWKCKKNIVDGGCQVWLGMGVEGRGWSIGRGLVGSNVGGRGDVG